VPPLSLPDDCLVYRAVLKRDFIDQETRRPRPGAFLPRNSVKKKDGSTGREEDLSVSIAAELSADDLAASFSKCYGIAQLQVGAIRRLGPGLGRDLDVKRDPAEDAPRGHALITGMPHPSQDPTRAERLATLLVELAGELVWPRTTG
jgi:hypothetical protein